MFEVFFDGDCPLCLREINMIRALDRRGRLRFTDIAAPGFDPAPTGLTQDQLMASIRGRMPSGEMVEGVEVFRQLYGAVGLGPLIPLTRLPGVRHTLDAAYRIFARNRLRLTGRCTTDSCAVPESA
jgi:predicted DCC family thiol-disulfide oxidoreductase YuxK